VYPVTSSYLSLADPQFPWLDKNQVQILVRECVADERNRNWRVVVEKLTEAEARRQGISFTMADVLSLWSTDRGQGL
jgi:hypothetical protein